MKIKKRKHAVDDESSSEMTKVKDEPISPNDVICLSDNSNADDSSDDSTDFSDSSESTDDDRHSSDTKDLKVVVKGGETQYSIKFATKMSMKKFKCMFLAVRRIMRRNEIANNIKVINFHIKKKKFIRKEKKKRRKNRKTEITKTANKCNSADKTEPKIEPKSKIVEETVIQPNPRVWVKPPTPQPTIVEETVIQPNPRVWVKPPIPHPEIEEETVIQPNPRVWVKPPTPQPAIVEETVNQPNPRVWVQPPTPQPAIVEETVNQPNPRVWVKSPIPHLAIEEETVIQPNPPVWVKPSTPQPENLNSAQSLKLSIFKDNIISSDCNNEAFLLANVDTNRVKIATNNTSSFTRYEDLNNGDLDYIEETMDLNFPIAEELAPKNLLKDTERSSNLSALNASQSPVQMIDNSSFQQEIKYEPELIINEDEEVFRPTENVLNIPLIEKIKAEPREINSKSANSGIDDQMTNTASTDLERMLIKNEFVNEEPISSKSNVITLSDEEDRKKLIMENDKKAIETDKSKGNSKNIVHHCKNLSKDAALADSSDDDLKYHETRRNQLLNEISMLSTDEETSHELVEKDSTNSAKKRNFEETLLSSDCSDYAAKNSAAKKKLRTKISRIESDNEMETTDEEVTFGNFGNQSNESNIKTDCEKVFPENSKNSDQKEIHVRPKSRQEIRQLNEKNFHDEKKAHCKKRSHDETKTFNEETFSVKKKRNNEKFADKIKSSHENITRKKSGGEKICKKEKLQVQKNCKEKSKEEISDRLNKSEHKVKSHKNDAIRRQSSESKFPRISEIKNDSINKNSNCANSAVSPQLMPCATPVVVLTKLNDQTQNSSPSESVNPIKDKSNIKNITKSCIKQEAQTSSTKIIDIQDNNHKISTPEPKNSASKSKTKLNRDFTLKSKLETKIDPAINKSSTKQETQTSSAKSVNPLDNKRKVSTSEPNYSASKSETKYDLDNTKSSIKQEALTASIKNIDSVDNKRKVSYPEPKYSTSKSEIKYDLDNPKSSTNQEPQIPSTKRLDCLDNRRKVTTPEPKYPASQSMKKLNRDWTLKSETETKNDPEKDEHRRKSLDSVSIDKLNTNKTEQYEKGTFNEVAMEILIEQSQKKVEEIQNLVINSGVTIVKLQMTMEARGNLVNEEPGKSAKQFVEFKQTSSVDKNVDKRENVNQCSEVKERQDKSAELANEMTVIENVSPADYEKFGDVKTEKKKSLDSDSKEIFADEKPIPVKKNDFSKVKAETHKSLDAANEFVPKSGIDVDKAEKISSKKTNFPYDIERKPVTSFVGRIPKKTACQSNSSPIGITLNCSENNYAHTSNENSITSEEKSPNDIISVSKCIMDTALPIVKGTKQQNTLNVPPLLPNFPPKIPRTLPQFVQQILHWEPSWFKDNDVNAIKKLFGENYIGIKPTYKSYDDFYRDAESLLALQILDPLTCVSDKSHFKYSIVKGSIRPKKILNTDVEMTTLKLDILIPRRDSLKEMYPIEGDLISFNYRSADRITKFINENEVFAIIENVRSEIMSDRTILKSHLRKFVHNPYELRTYTVMTKCIHDQIIHAKRVKTMTMISESHHNLKNFPALKNLLYSPLLKYIIHPKVEDYQLPVVFTTYYPLATKDNLDAQQLDAVARITEAAIRRDPKICLIQGPPGTGKTKVVINIVRQLIHLSGKLDKNWPFRILVCAPSNSAVDEIAIRLLEERQKIAKDKKGERFRMVRVGFYGNINPKVKEISLEDLTQKEFDRFNDAVLKYDYEKMRKSIQFHSEQDYQFRIQKTGAKWYGARNHITRKLEDNKARWDFLKNRKFGRDNPLDEEETKALYKAAESTVLEGAQVIVCTLTCSSKNCMESVFGGAENGFSTCIIDESTKSSEVETLLPLQLGVKTLILVGDTIQHPLCLETKLHGLDRSLFARVRQAFSEQPENPIIHFQAQYRMAYPVAYWPQQYFYNGNLHNCANLRCLPLERYKVMNLDFTQEDNEGMMNEYEGVFVANLIMILMTRAGLDAFEHPVRISVITPYHRQKAFIYNEIKHIMDRLPIELKQKIIVDVHTIDGIQGQERDIIIMSCVTTSGTRFLSDKQKLCMALTRAKNSMILCGNFRTYWKDTMWESLLNEAQSRHFYVNVPRYTHEDDIVAHIVR